MAIQQIRGFVVPMLGDGVSTTFSIDYTNLIEIQGILPKSPSAIFNVTGLWSGVSLISATVRGQTVDFVLASAPASNVTANVGVNFLF